MTLRTTYCVLRRERTSRCALRMALAAVMMLACAPAMRADAQTPQPSQPVAVRKPEGYIGIRYSGDQKIERVSGRWVMSYTRYPVIEGIEPGSPAERAGLAAGDTILAFNGNDLRADPFPLYDMLRPGALLVVGVRRNGHVRYVTVTVGRRQQEYLLAPQIAQISAEVRREIEQAQKELRRELQRAERERARETAAEERERTRELARAQRELARALEEQRREIAQAEAEQRRTTRAAASAAPLLAYTLMTMSGIGGAEVTPLNEGLADALGVRKGIFVVNAPQGTPAANAGLRGGDVIVKVGGVEVEDLSRLRAIMQEEQRDARQDRRSRHLALEVVRKRHRKTVTLRW